MHLSNWVFLQSKHFECLCQKCNDPTELGSHGSSVRCLQCKNGFLMPPKWICDSCESKLPMEIGENVLFKAYKESEELLNVKSNRTIEKYEQYINLYKMILHPGNIHEIHAFDLLK